jgi:hypothetical protein
MSRTFSRCTAGAKYNPIHMGIPLIKKLEKKFAYNPIHMGLPMFS